ncbi:MAG TPA: ThuA domain-containing protein, partial [Armatimonadota bacterium]|nr:ThuA domain-containing protein [Armatimonadota bacterium]
VESCRRLVLNAIAWSAKAEVPEGGVQSYLPTSEDDGLAAEAPIRALVLTGRHHPAHDWRATTEALRQVLGRDPRVRVEVWEDPERLAAADLSGYDLIVQNYNNWESATLSAPSREKLLRFVRDGGGLIVVHFANGAWLDWPDYRRLSRRTWIDGTSGHDAFGPFRVQIRKTDHPITQGVPASFDTTDELYFRQQGDLPVEVLATAHSKVTGHDEPLLFVHEEGRGRVFQSLLGHDADAIRTPAVAAMFRRAAAWVAHREPAGIPVEAAVSAPLLVPGRHGTAFNAAAGPAAAPAKPAYQSPPLTVECWARLTGKSGYNVLVANAPKESTTHWEVYTNPGSGNLCAYLPGNQPATLDSGVPVVDGRWHYLAMTYLPGRARLYVDGRQVAETALTPREPAATTGPLYLGGYPPQGIRCDGALDEVRVSNTARTINSVPEAPFTADASTVGLWRFDGLEGRSFADISGQKNAVSVLNTTDAGEPQPETVSSA